MENVPKELKKIDETTWELPTSYKQGMNVPARFIATEHLIKNMDEGVFNQLTNVACLPGIERYAICHADGHWGYGFPIGGVAAFDLETGIISPGGIGFDINCLPPDTKINLENGTWQTMEELEKNWGEKEIDFFNHKSKSRDRTNIVCFMKKHENKSLYAINSKSGRKIKSTADHPILTKRGMVKAENLTSNDEILLHGFKGVKYEEPSNETIVTKKQIEETLDNLKITNKGNARSQILNFLEKRNLLELKHDSPKIPILLKLIGFIFGDGTMSFENQLGQVGFYGKEEDMQEVKKDLIKLGFKTAEPYKRFRHHVFEINGRISDFEHEEVSINKKSNALVALLMTLGTPKGKKTEQVYRVPTWIMKAPKWQKRLFIASFFGAELSKPATIKRDKYTFYVPQLNMNKAKRLKENAIDFLNDIRLLLSELGVESNYPVFVEGNNYKGKISNTVGLRITMPNTSENLINLFENVGYEYCNYKENLASLASNYLRLKKKIVDYRETTRRKAKELYSLGKSRGEILKALESEYINQRFIIRSIYERTVTKTRVAYNLLTFQEYIEKNAYGKGFSWDEIESIEKEDYNGLVYDLTINDDSHNFIANNITVSNCGMRLLTTNLTWKEVQPKIKELVDHLFKIVPAGVGRGGFVQVTKQKFKDVAEQGSQWAIENGYGWEEDVKKTESLGKIEWADSSKISDKAIKRGMGQIGTLGSGNHYLEIQTADQIFNEKLAKSFGITQKNQVVVMFHCGSRGFGHQIGTDYLKLFDEAMKKYNITVPDRELACAPFQSNEGQDYFKAMACAANMAFANRQVILHRIRQGFQEIFKKTPEDLEMNQVYDVAHNIAKVETYKNKKLLVHRKGSTRAFGPGNKELSKEYQKTGQPVILGGSMETGSYLLVGTKKAEQETFGSTAHGSGRVMSRRKAKQLVRGDQLQKDMEKHGIYVKTTSYSGLAEEGGYAYKPVTEVVDAISKAGISTPVVSLKPKGNVKG
tara:strand:- start:5114 stop:8074 length:2961 start_codon:yes stop_codon:yes gene_type:complete